MNSDIDFNTLSDDDFEKYMAGELPQQQAPQRPTHHRGTELKTKPAKPVKQAPTQAHSQFDDMSTEDLRDELERRGVSGTRHWSEQFKADAHIPLHNSQKNMHMLLGELDTDTQNEIMGRINQQRTSTRFGGYAETGKHYSDIHDLADDIQQSKLGDDLTQMVESYIR